MVEKPSMRLRSIGHRTDVMLHRLTADVRVAADHVVVRTPSNPRFYWGNYIIFAAPPSRGDLERWSAIFREEIGEPPEIGHLAFSWDEPTGVAGEIEPFLTAGFTRDDLVVMTASALRRPPAGPEDAVIRQVRSDADWDAWLALVVAQNEAQPADETEPAEHFRRYVEARAVELRRMLSTGTGRWFGAFLEGRLVASAGIFADAGLGRFQMVDTHPAFRRRGLARAVINHAAAVASRELGVTTLVIVADANYFAKDLYAGLGFTPVERLVELTRRPEVQ